MSTALMDLEVLNLTELDSRVMLCDEGGPIEDGCCCSSCCCCCCSCCSCCEGECEEIETLA